MKKASIYLYLCGTIVVIVSAIIGVVTQEKRVIPMVFLAGALVGSFGAAVYRFGNDYRRLTLISHSKLWRALLWLVMASVLLYIVLGFVRRGIYDHGLLLWTQCVAAIVGVVALFCVAIRMISDGLFLRMKKRRRK